MATALNNMKTKAFCDEVYAELAGMKKRLADMRARLEAAYGVDTDIYDKFDRHLCELADQIEWKLQILSHACPFDWKGSVEYGESIVSVGQPETASGPDFSGGYIGG